MPWKWILRVEHSIFFYESAKPGWFLKGFALTEFPYLLYSDRQVWVNSVDPDQMPQNAV